MNMNPWQAEQMAADRMENLERAAGAQRRYLETVTESAVGPTRPRPAVARHVGALLIAMGRRLAEPDAFPAAFDGPHHR
jgi:hypothetical protein